MNQTMKLLRLPEVLKQFPVNRSEWFEGVKAGRYPKPVKLTERTVAWVESEIQDLIQATIIKTRG